MRTLKVVFLGYGYMGKLAYGALKQLTTRYSEVGITLKLIGLLDIDPSCISQAVRFLEMDSAVLLDQQGGAEAIIAALRHDIRLTANDIFVLYDATPTQAHAANFTQIQLHFPQAVYLGEKPIFVQRSCRQSVQLLGSRAFCDFIETESQVVRRRIGSMVSSVRASCPTQAQ